MYGVLQFTSKSRVQGTGVPFMEYKTNQTFTVHTKKEYNKDMWSKIGANNELMEIFGPIGEYDAELSALRGVYGIYYKYPSSYILPYTPTLEGEYNAYTVDQESTLDRDDAISVKKEEDSITVGIHITDISRRLPNEWVYWAHMIGSSAYWKKGTKPIFPPLIANHTLSLTKGETYPCLSLFLTYKKNGELISMKFGSYDVSITDNLTYEQFSGHKDRYILSFISGKIKSEEIIEWCMIQYNLYIAENLPDVLLRIQDEDEPARYDFTGTHFAMNRIYAHATSPIRRFSDFYNQCMYHNRCDVMLKDKDLIKLNKRMEDVRSFHQRETVMSLAYELKTPKIVDAFVEINEEGPCICLTIDGKRVWIPLCDSYYDEPISEKLEEGTIHRLQCFGIHKNGKATLRIRLIAPLI